MSTNEPIDFYFDFSSPYSYIASELIDPLAARFGRKVKWHPILLGPVFKATGSAPLTLQTPVKAQYWSIDFSRSARFHGLPYRHPTKFPLATYGAARVYYGLHGKDCGVARAFAHAAFRALFVDDRDISQDELVLDLAVAAGSTRQEATQFMQDQALKDRLRNETDQAMARGVFGAPFFFVDGEPFFGADRLPQIEHCLLPPPQPSPTGGGRG